MYTLFKGVGNYWEKALYFIDGWQHQRAIKCYLILRNWGLLNHLLPWVLKCLLMHAVKWNWYSITCIMCNGYIYSHQTGWTSLVLEFLHLVSTVLFSCNLNSVKLVKVKSPYHLILCSGILPVSFATSFENATTEN